ncbi:MAG: hypothetical protein VXZ84_06245 [Planctomycetota bacterium]|nr:hypothetical protein [Planctomycetota bacterium]
MRDLLGKILFWLMGVELPPGGNDLRWQLVGNWEWTRGPVLWFIIFVLLSGIYFSSFYFREASRATPAARLFLVAVRSTLVILVISVLLFQLQIQFTRMQLPTLAILVDRSASMSVIDDYQDPATLRSLQAIGLNPESTDVSRWNIAEQLLDPQTFNRLFENYDVRVFSVAESARALNLAGLALQPESQEYAADIKKLQPNGESSRLGASVQRVLSSLRGRRLAAMVILSDGITTEGVDLAGAAETARALAVPLYLAGIGSEKKARELLVADLVVDEIVFVNDYVDFDFKLTVEGLKGKPIELVLRDATTGEVIQRRAVTGGDDGIATRETLSDRPTRIGQREYTVEATVTGSKEQEISSRLSRSIEVRDDPIKVLLVQNAPSFEFKYLKHLLERDKTIDLSVVLQQADIEYPEQDRFALPLFPVSREKLFQYDVIILGDIDLNQMSRRELENVAEFVEEKGGGLLIFSGRNFELADFMQSPLKDLLPFTSTAETVVKAEASKMQPTPIGLRSPHMQLGDTSAETALLWKRLPEIYGIHAIDQVKPTARVLAETDSSTAPDGQPLPILVIHFVPPGKVLWHATDETYRWRYRVGDALYARYWIQAIRYLSRSKLLGEKGVELTTDKLEYEPSQQVKIQARFFDERLVPEAEDGVVAILEGSGQRNRIVLERSPHRSSIFEGSGGKLPVGNYEVVLSRPMLGKDALAASFTVVAPAGEMTRTALDQLQLQQAAERSRGRYFSLENVNKLFVVLPEGERVPVATLPPIPLWNNWRTFMLLFVLLLTEWLLRKRLGML